MGTVSAVQSCLCEAVLVIAIVHKVGASPIEVHKNRLGLNKMLSCILICIHMQV